MSALCYTVAELCHQFKIGKTFFYDKLKRGEGPRVIKLGRRTLISADAAREWITKLEAGTPAITE